MPEEVLIEQASDGAATKATATLVVATDHTLAGANAERDKLTVSANIADVWLSLGTSAAVVNTGIVVRAGGAPYEITGWKGAVHCISSGAAVVGITETSFHAGDDQGEEQSGADTFIPSGPSDDYWETAVATGPAPGVPYPPNA